MIKEELNTKMHSEFKVPKKTDIKHKSFAALRSMSDLKYTKEKAADIYDVTVSDIEKHKPEFNLLSI